MKTINTLTKRQRQVLALIRQEKFGIFVFNDLKSRIFVWNQWDKERIFIAKETFKALLKANKIFHWDTKYGDYCTIKIYLYKPYVKTK